jgi:uncharacterized protein (TIGR03000 family)
MFRKIIPLLLTGAAALAMPSFAQAQHGGHGGGGGHVGGAHMGGGHVGGSFGGFHPNGFRGFHNDFRGFHNGFGGFYPYHGGYGGYGYYSPYYSGAYSSPSYDVTPDYAYTPPPTGNYQSMYPPSPTAQVTVNVPPDAKVWFDDTLTKSTGAVRQYTTPPLSLGGQYSYDIRAQWTEDGREVTQSQKVQFNRGGQVVVNFPMPPATSSPETGPVPQKR